MRYSLERRKQASGIMMVAPSVIALSVFVIFPIINSIYLSFLDYNLLKGVREFAAFSNYTHIFQDSRFWGALWNTCYFTLGYVPLLTIIALFLAVLLDRKMQVAVKLFQAIYFLPAIKIS